MTIKLKDFPSDFLFGTATSAYQIEGHKFGGAGETHWDTFAATPGNVVNAENGDLACDHYHRYADDFSLIKEAGLKAYRFSTSWARILPEGRGQPNQKGLDFYDRLVDDLCAKDIAPYLTLYHWELPSTLSDLGGWRNRDIAKWFGDYTDVIMKRIGDRIEAVAPINEPWCVAWLSHFMGAHAPGFRDIRAAAHAMHHVLLAHGESISRMRAMGQKNLGAVFNMEYAMPADGSAEAQQRCDTYDAIYNHWFIQAVQRGSYPEKALAGLEKYMPKDWEEDMTAISQPIDWIGINYYTRKLIGPDGTETFPALKEVEGPLPKTAMDWEIYPEGLYNFIKQVNDDYADGLPIYITENGMANYDEVTGDTCDDPARIAYISDHLAAVKKATDEGANVKGYFIWSLLDNYEWALGYDKRFGLVHVDFETLKRTPKSSYHWLKSELTS